MKNIILLVVISLSFIFSTTCHAQPTLYLGLKSHHFKQCTACGGGDWNETHDLIGYSNKSWMVAHMTNSYNKQSLYIGRRWWYDMNSHIRPYVTLGLATGYTDKIGIDIGPVTTTGFMGIEIHTADERFGFIISTIPGEVVAIGFKMGLKM